MGVPTTETAAQAGLWRMGAAVRNPLAAGSSCEYSCVMIVE